MEIRGAGPMPTTVKPDGVEGRLGSVVLDSHVGHEARSY
jgi:hypothetical protein